MESTKAKRKGHPMPTETIYQPPGGEGPSVVRETEIRCLRCVYVGQAWGKGFVCEHPKVGEREMDDPRYEPSPSWCPIVSAAPAGKRRRLRPSVRWQI